MLVFFPKYSRYFHFSYAVNFRALQKRSLHDNTIKLSTKSVGSRLLLVACGFQLLVVVIAGLKKVLNRKERTDKMSYKKSHNCKG